MENRIGFKDNLIRENFFLSVRNSGNAQSWGELAKRFGYNRSHFQQYQHGQLLLPESLFQKMLDLLPEENKNQFRHSIFTKEKN